MIRGVQKILNRGGIIEVVGWMLQVGWSGREGWKKDKERKRERRKGRNRLQTRGVFVEKNTRKSNASLPLTSVKKN